jgi:hypothetical protein
MPEDIKPPLLTVPSGPIPPHPPDHSAGTLIMPATNTSGQNKPPTTPVPPPAPAKPIQPISVAPASAPPLSSPPPPVEQSPPADMLPTEIEPAGPLSNMPPDETQLQAMRRTYRVPVEKLARRYGAGRHTMLIVGLLFLVVGAGVAALLLTGALSL